MTLQQLSKALTSLYNNLGNEWIVENLKSEPFKFTVYVRKGDDSDLTDYVVEVYSDRPIPKNMSYRNPSEQSSGAEGIHYSVIQHIFKQMIDYVEKFGDFRRTIGVKLMDLI